MPIEKTVLEFAPGEICYSTSRDPAKCIVIRQEGNRVLVNDDPDCKYPTWYPIEKLRAPVKGEDGFRK